MDAKSKAEFINSVASGDTVVCPKCSAANKPEYKFCIICGAEMTPVSGGSEKKPAFKQSVDTSSQEKSKYEEPETVFAKGLPDWSIEPPLVMVRRRR